MDNVEEAAGAKPHPAAKVIIDLSDLVAAILTSLPSVKPWQRQLRLHLLDIDKWVQVLRMTIAMDRPAGEVTDAVEKVRTALRVAQRYLAVGRADLGTKAAVALACELGLKIDAALT